MSGEKKVSRREFLKQAGLTVSAAVLASCTPRKPVPPAWTPTAKPTSIPSKTIASTATMAPSATPVAAITPEMVLVEAGNFMMGAVDGQSDEGPVHEVRITQPFYMGVYAVTFAEYDQFCADTRNNAPDDRGWGRGRQPAIHVDWTNVTDYCNWLSEKEGLTPCYSGKGKLTQCDFTANGYRLPTEAEWEYAARGGVKSQGFIYAGSDDPLAVAWFDQNSDGRTHPVGEKQPNELGLYDMSGNLYEWCWDWYGKEYYAESPVEDPLGGPAPKSSTPWDWERVRRSGSWRETAESVRVTFRSFDSTNYPGDNGFRLVRTTQSVI
jgi:formylglycine-generating enzyme required for sulfatase activity